MTRKRRGGGPILPAPPGTCPVCAAEHLPGEPHWMTFYFIYRFFEAEGRVPDWEDALAHCNPEVREAWREELRRGGVAI